MELLSKPAAECNFVHDSFTDEGSITCLNSNTVDTTVDNIAEPNSVDFLSITMKLFTSLAMEGSLTIVFLVQHLNYWVMFQQIQILLVEMQRILF